MVDLDNIKEDIKQVGGYALAYFSPYIIHSAPDFLKPLAAAATTVPFVYSVWRDRDELYNKNEDGPGKYRRIARLVGGFTAGAIGGYVGLNYGWYSGMLGQGIGFALGSFGDKIIRFFQVACYPELRAVEDYLSMQSDENVRIGILDAFNIRKSLARTYLALEGEGAKTNNLMQYIMADRIGLGGSGAEDGTAQPKAETGKEGKGILSRIGSGYLSIGKYLAQK